MPPKTFRNLWILAFAFLPLLLACGQGEEASLSLQEPAAKWRSTVPTHNGNSFSPFQEMGGQWEVFPITAAQNYDVGDIGIKNDGETLYVAYVLYMGWMVETHLHVATSLAGIPQKNGNPIPGQFDDKTNHQGYTTVYVYEIPLEAGWVPGTMLYVATHGVMTGGCGLQETFWGGTEPFDGNSWGYYINYIVK